MKRPSPVEPNRLRDLPPDEDLVGVAELIDAASPLPELTAADRQRIRGDLGRALSRSHSRRVRWWRLRLSPALVVILAMVSAGVGGAAVQSIVTGRRSAGEGPDRERAAAAPGGSTHHKARRPGKVVAAADPALDSAPAPEDAPVTVPVEEAPAVAPVEAPAIAPAGVPASATAAPGAVARRGVERGAIAASTARPPDRVAAPGGPPSGFEPPPLEAQPLPLSPEAAGLADAIRVLRRDGDANAALALLDRQRARFPHGPLAPEVTAVRIEALLKANRAASALVELDAFPMESVPGHAEWRVARGELRANVGRWRDAEADFGAALARLSEGTRADLAERALWGRGVARARRGEIAGAEADYALYLERFPDGRFATQVRLALGPRAAVAPQVAAPAPQGPAAPAPQGPAPRAP
jgi:hypothetical protein